MSLCDQHGRGSKICSIDMTIPSGGRVGNLIVAVGEAGANCPHEVRMTRGWCCSRGGRAYYEQCGFIGMWWVSYNAFGWANDLFKLCRLYL